MRRPVSGLVIDRVTLAWASDKSSLWGKISDVTVSNSLFYGSDKAVLVSLSFAWFDTSQIADVSPICVNPRDKAPVSCRSSPSWPEAPARIRR